MEKIEIKFKEQIEKCREYYMNIKREIDSSETIIRESKDEIARKKKQIELAKANYEELKVDYQLKLKQQIEIAQHLAVQEQQDQENQYGIMKNSYFNIMIIQAEKLKTYDLIGKGDPYFVIEFEGQQFKTKVAQSGKLAEFYEEFTFNVQNAQEDIIITSMDQNKHKNDDKTGKTTIDL